MSTIGKTIRCKAAVTWDADKLSIEEVEIAPPKDKEVRLNIIPQKDSTLVKAAFLWPIIHGHEGSGIVESVGKDVTYVKPGDHVITTYIPRCGKCVYCNNNSTVVRTNFCQMFLNQLSGLMPDGTSRITCKGQQIVITDAIPLFHHWTTLTPMLEVGLQQVDIYAKRNKHNVVGYYHGNERVDDNKLPPF
ncbi:8385_t:CDS:10, partial [Entrophospora sp. SA101]